nr:ARID DNA-binding domain-containing protein [Tanacetum cinerariifolium]
MVNTNHFLVRNWNKGFPSRSTLEHWHQSTKPGKYRNKPSQMKFVQRKIRREIEGFGPYARQITKECKEMLRNKIEHINLFNSTLSSNKFRDYACFHCTQKGHVAKSCPTKLSDERLYAQAGSTTFKHGDEANRARIKMNKDMVACFKCHERGHFANKCPQGTKAIPNHEKPTVSIKYPEFIFFKTKGILKGTDMDTWDDFWYMSSTMNKHMTSNLEFFTNLKEDFSVDFLDEQKKFLFTYVIGEVLISNGDRTYLIPGVQYAPEITLNILSKSLLKQQGFDTIFERDRCILAYMFKDHHGKNVDLDKMKQRHNDYLDDYFDSLDKGMNIKRRIEPICDETKDDGDVHNFQECVASLNLIKQDNGTSKEWDDHRDKFNKVLKWFFNHYLNRSLPGMLPPTIKGVTIHLFDL